MQIEIAPTRLRNFIITKLRHNYVNKLTANNATHKIYVVLSYNCNKQPNSKLSIQTYFPHFAKQKEIIFIKNNGNDSNFLIAACE